jgi:GH18 family chitinase
MDNNITTVVGLVNLMKYLFSSLFFFGCALWRISAEPVFSVITYLPEWRYGSANFEIICSISTHLIFFSLEPSPDGRIVGYDRFPGDDVLSDARNKGCKLMICFGGNGRSSGFSSMTRNPQTRKKFVLELKALMTKYQFDGVDYNWEYPGYAFGQGYGTESEVKKDYQGLLDLIIETRKALGSSSTISLAYYPDRRQEQVLLDTTIASIVDFLHIMAYDQSGGDHHSSYEFGISVLNQGIKIGLPKRKLTLGLPFYGRNSVTGDWTTYEDLVQRYHPLNGSLDQVTLTTSKSRSRSKKDKAFITFNGIETIKKKTQYALDQQAGGVMIWEGGQDCRVQEVTRGGQTHVVTCPDGEESSLFIAIKRVVEGRDKREIKSEL